MGNEEILPDESFISCLKYFQENEELFIPRQVSFLKSVLSYENDITARQRAAFIRTVMTVWSEENQYREQYMRAINRVK